MKTNKTKSKKPQKKVVLKKRTDKQKVARVKTLIRDLDTMSCMLGYEGPGRIIDQIADRIEDAISDPQPPVKF